MRRGDDRGPETCPVCGERCAEEYLYQAARCMLLLFKSLHASIWCVLQDEISTGLDSSTTYQIVRSARNFAHILEVINNISCILDNCSWNRGCLHASC